MSAILWLVSLPFRVLGYLAVIGACGAGFWDLWQSVQQDRMVLTPLGDLWARLWPEGQAMAAAGLREGIHPALWDQLAVNFLRLPGFMALLILAAVALVIGHFIYRPR